MKPLFQKHVDPIAIKVAKAIAQVRESPISVEEFAAIKTTLHDFVKPSMPKCPGNMRHWFTPYGYVGDRGKKCVRCEYVRK